MKLIPVLVLAGVALAFSGCRGNHDQPDGSGTIECTQVQIAPQVAGRLLKLAPQEGDVVTNGQWVAQLDSADYVLKRNEAQASVDQAKAQLDLLLAGTRQEDVERARAQVREAQALAEASKADYERVREVFEKKSATRKQLDDAEALRERTAASLTAAEQNLAKLIAGTRKEEIQVARAQVELAQAKLASLEKAITDCTILAPASGVVTTRSREEGEMVSVGTPLLTLSRLDEVWLSLYIPESKLGQVKLGQPAQVRIDGDPKFHPGTVTFISPEAEFTPKNVQTPDERAKLVFRVKVTLANPQGVFKPGMPADGFLRTNK